MSELTRHGENIANDIQGADAYGGSGPLTDADVWLIVDNIHRALMDSREPNDPIFKILENAMRALEAHDADLPV